MRGGHHRSLYSIRNFGPRCRTGGPPRLFRRSPRNHRLWGTIHQARPAAVAHFASSSAGLSFRTPISTTAGADQVLAVYNDRLAGSRLCDAGGVGHAQRLAAPQLLSRSPPRASRAGSLPKVPALKRSTLHAGSKHAEILSKQAEIVLKQAKKLGKQLTGW